ncbi:restriction endonuclease subunit S [Aeromonas veronii]|uniref:restriction endonuclease subunit S n=1 Tax=Aeromonas veronii TaxID=654 RepID=UPI00191F8C7B|nr:restriction endonuclease subunit S [Aeromonas veronii]MBL0466848.1 restriction endonuclease subunit S [Aeromonas veronii]
MSSEFLPTKLGEVLDFANGKTSPERSNNGRWPVYGSNGIIGTADATNSIADTIVIGRVGSYCGSVYLSATQCWVTDNAIRGTAKGNNSAVFLFYLLKHLNLNNWRSGSGQPLLNQSILNSIDVYIPEPPEQQEIGTFLSCIDDRIALLRETNATLEAIAQALFKSWFVDFDPVHARARGEQPAGLAPEVAALFPDSFEESAHGMIPKGWRVGCIGHLGEVVCGKTPPTSDPDNYGEDVPFITIPDMHGYLAVTSTARSLSRKGADSQPKKYLPAGSICVSCIATPGLVVQVTESSHTNQQINSVIPHLGWGRSFPLFLLRRIGDKVRAGGSGGSVFHNLSKSSFEKIPELLPTNNLAQQYCQIVDPLVEKIIDNQRQAQTLATLRDTLLPRLISGQLRLPDAEQQLKDLAV